MSTERVLNFEITTTLAVSQLDADGGAVAINADALPTLEIVQAGVVVNEAESAVVTTTGTGAYACAWTPLLVGRHVLTWTFLVGGDEFTEEEKVDVVADISGASDSALAEDVVLEVPDLGLSKVCRVVGQFYDASGFGAAGIYVRFTPDRDTTSFLADGIVAVEVTAVTDADGALEMYLARGVTGILAITGVGVVRRITVPATGQINIKDLADLGDDPFEVQSPKFYKLPRSS
jgi:hypothetical protein